MTRSIEPKPQIYMTLTLSPKRPKEKEEKKYVICSRCIHHFNCEKYPQFPKCSDVLMCSKCGKCSHFDIKKYIGSREAYLGLNCHTFEFCIFRICIINLLNLICSLLYFLYYVCLSFEFELCKFVIPYPLYFVLLLICIIVKLL